MTLSANALSFRYEKGGPQILDKFSLAIDPGERVGLNAPSGFGKTTLAKIVAGYMDADEGEVLLGGRHIRSYKGYCPVQLIWQHPELVLNPRLRLRYALAEAGVMDGRILDGLGIEDEWLDRYPIELSGGELQRFCIARALGEPTRFIIADEITAMLDVLTQARIWTFLSRETARRNIGMLVISHSEPLLDVVCTRRIDMVCHIQRAAR